MATTTGTSATRSPRHCDEIELFPSLGRFDSVRDDWLLTIRGHVTRPRRPGLGLRLLERFYRQAFRLSAEEASSQCYRDRIQGFLERGRGGTFVRLHLAEHTCELDRPSRASGHFQGTLRIPRRAVESLASDEMLDRWFDFQASAIRAPERAPGRALLMTASGPSVISDIDDTIKSTQVGQRRRLIENTFLLPFQPIRGMPAAYQAWQQRGATFHYVSSSPWQLFRPLHEFLTTSSYPDGSYHLRSIQLRDPSILQLVIGKKRSKKRAINSILKWFPQRQFVLVGDAGEKDPELYGAFARKYAPQIAQIFIRRLPGVALGADRLHRAFRRVDPSKWKLFAEPDELLQIEPRLSGWKQS